MKNAILSNYNFDNITIMKSKNNIYIINNGYKYLLMPIESEYYFAEIYKIINIYDLKNLFYDIILTRENRISILYNNINYALIRIKEAKANILNPTNFQSIKINNGSFLVPNWKNLWCMKNDYIITKVKSNYEEWPIISASIDYYVGMAETAITYLNLVENLENEDLTLSYRYLMNAEDFYNPVNLTIDIKERTISEYLKYLFFSNNVSFDSIRVFLIEPQMTKSSYVKIVARLLYPNYYFNYLENYMAGIISEHEIKKIIENSQRYEIFISKIIEIINEKVKIKKIDWLARGL